MTLCRDLYNIAWRLSVRAPIIATPGLLNLTLELGFYLYHQYDLGMGLHQLGLVQHTPGACKVLKARADQHQVIAGGGAASSLADAAPLTSPDDVTLPATLVMALGSHVGLRTVLVTLFGPDHPTALSMK